MKFYKLFLIIFIISLIQTDLNSDTLGTHEIKLLLDKNEFVEGDTILLKIEFDFNKGDSIAYFYTLDFLFGIILSDENGQNFREITYFVSKIGRVISPEIPVRPNEVKRIETNLNCDYTTEENYYTFDNRCLVNLSPGIYAVKFDDYRLSSWFGRNVSSNTLTFKILSKDK